MTEPSAKVILDSISPNGDRLTTMEVVIHRFVLAEFNTHRVFSRNSASSRARPLRKTIEQVTLDVARPVVWATEQKGMQGGPPLDEESGAAALAEGLWDVARDNALLAAYQLNNLGVHKSITNRLIEPFMYHTIIVSSTEWDGFWRQRCSVLAQPEIKMAAEAMRDAYLDSIPRAVGYGRWHKPYINDRDEYDCEQSGEDPRFVSAARCGRVSYLTHDGKRDVQEDVDMYNRLISADPPHASPLEHVATPWSYEDLGDGSRAEAPGNFHGWSQLRHLVLGW